MNMGEVKLLKDYDEYRISAHFTLGDRDYYEDEYVIHRNKKNLTFFGIFDGHGGREAAQYAKDNLFKNILCNLNPQNEIIQTYNNDDDSFMRAIKKGFADTQEGMWTAIEKWPKTHRDFPSTSGTTASISILRCDRVNGVNHYKLYVGHVGDTKIIMAKEDPTTKLWSGLELTKDHVPKEASENARIFSMGGEVRTNRIVWNRPKVNQGSVKKNCQVPYELTDQIPFLSVSRSLGDLWSWSPRFNDFIVSPVPDVLVTELDFSIHKSLMLASDGLWNVVSIKEAVENLKITANLHYLSKLRPELKFVEEEIVPAYRLVREANKNLRLKRGRADNITAVVIEFKYGELEEIQADMEIDTQLVPQMVPPPPKPIIQKGILNSFRRPAIPPMRESSNRDKPNEMFRMEESQGNGILVIEPLDIVEINKSPEKAKTVEQVEISDSSEVSPSLIPASPTFTFPDSTTMDRSDRNIEIFNEVLKLEEKKKGRPSVSFKIPAKSAVDVTSESDQASTVSPKRGPGRPRKKQNESGFATGNLNESDTSDNELHVVTTDEETSNWADQQRKQKTDANLSKIILTREDADDLDFFHENQFNVTFPIAPKKRGRPPKSALLLSDSECSSFSEKPILKKRGRPFKTLSLNKSEQEKTPTKKRGRPFKNKKLGHETSGTGSVVGSVKSSRNKRGRPRKNPLDESKRTRDSEEKIAQMNVSIDVSIQPKKRGRPPKNGKLSSAGSNDSKREPPLIVKRKVGRPPKENSIGREIRFGSVKVPKGTPAKNRMELKDVAGQGTGEFSGGETQEISPLKRKVGRPKKETVMAKLQTGEEMSEGEVSIVSTKKLVRPFWGYENQVFNEEDGDTTDFDYVSEGEEGTPKLIKVEANVSEFELEAEGNEFDENKTEEIEIVKRKRGRPRKNRDNEKNGEIKNDEIEQEEGKGQMELIESSAKRQRKTPRKFQEYSLAEVVMSSDNESVIIRESANGQKKRGRPLKVKTEMGSPTGSARSTLHSENGEERAKRKRGRPPKSLSI